MKTSAKWAARLGCGFLVLMALLASLSQFCADNLIPLVFLALLTGLIGFVNPRWRKASAGFFAAITLLFLADGFFFQHRMALWCRISATFFNTSQIEEVLPSPSGKTVAYVVGDHWLDSFYNVHISDGGLFPKTSSVPSRLSHASYRRDATARWDGEIFSIKLDGDTLRYSEKNRAFERLPSSAETAL